MYKNISRDFKSEPQTCPSACKPMLLDIKRVFQKSPLYKGHPNYVEPKEVFISIRKPELVNVIEANYVYTLWKFATEFGGYVGLFFGNCVLDLADLIVQVFLHLGQF